MTEAGAQIIFNYGVLGVLMCAFLWMVYKVGIWGAENVAKPIVEEYVNLFRNASNSLEETRQINQLVRELDDDVRETKRMLDGAWSDKTAVFSTHHTNRSIVLLAKALKKMAEVHQVDLTELVEAIEDEIGQQEHRKKTVD